MRKEVVVEVGVDLILMLCGRVQVVGNVSGSQPKGECPKNKTGEG